MNTTNTTQCNVYSSHSTVYYVYKQPCTYIYPTLKKIQPIRSQESRCILHVTGIVFHSGFPPWRARIRYFSASGCTYMRTGKQKLKSFSINCKAWNKKTKNCPLFLFKWILIHVAAIYRWWSQTIESSDSSQETD